ncbi:MAG TPA: hypothetical protein VGR71_16475, partial [Nitrospira sp.]|nr:hypothetical protein [Nitrospira sp.]
MSAGPSISLQKIIAATPHSPNLREVLQQLATTTQQQQAVTGTTPQSGTTAGQTNPSAPVPPQATGSVSILSKNYVVQLVPPGGTSPISKLQAQQAAGSATPLTPLQPVTPIYHQIRVSTSPAFNVNSNTQTFGGNTGSTQTYWTLTGLGSGTFYVQFRSSYDGINWNSWKNANGGTALGGLINQVTTENAGNSDWALFSLPGSLIMGIGAGEVVDQEIFNLAQQVFSSGMIAIAGPNGFPAQGNGVSGFMLSDVDLQVPTAPAAGIPDYPVEIRSQMAIADGHSVAPSNASVFAICFDPTNANVKLYPEPGGSTTWAVIRLPGGARVAFGQGNNLDGTQIWTPPALTWIDPSRIMLISTMTDTVQNRPPITGVGQCAAVGLLMQARYLNDAGNLTPAGIESANWMAVAWQPGTDVLNVNGQNFLQISLQGGHAIILGGGQVASGT